MQALPGVNGFVAPGYEPVGRLFARLFAAPGRGGGAFVVRRRDRVLVDIWGGYADPVARRPWERETLGLSFSTSKGVAAAVIHRLADRGLVDYEEPVATHWREFAASGKGAITVRQLLSHQAGLDDLGPIAKNVARFSITSAPRSGSLPVPAARHRPPTTRSPRVAASRAGTSGHRARHGGARRQRDQRTAGDRRTALRHLHGARAARAGARRLTRAVGALRRAGARRPTAAAPRLRSLYVDGIGSIFAGAQPGVLATVMPAVNGMFSAESLATLYAALANGGVAGDRRLLSAATVRALGRVQTRGPDRNLVIP